MNEAELLRSIRPAWLHRVVQSLARGSGVRQDIRSQMEQFFDLLVQTVESGDVTWLDSILNAWSTALTETDLAGDSSSVTTFLKEVMQLTFEVCQENLTAEDAVNVTALLIPGFAHSFEVTSLCEIKTRVAYATHELETLKHTVEKLDRSKSDFIAVAAHELKTPLTLVEGYAAMLREALANSSITEAEEMMLAGIHNGSRRLRVIIDDMVDVSLIDNNLLSLHFQPVWINRLLKSIGNELREAVEERQQLFEIEDFEGSNELTFGDPERLLQAIRNVLLNAIKYTPNGGKIHINGRRLPGFLEVVVTDTGIGIAPDDQAVIFEKFARLGNTATHSSGKTKFKGGGPGLGLHISKGIIEAHGGAIWVESPGYDEKTCPGSTFHILLPIHSTPPDPKTTKLFASLMQTQTEEEQ